MDDDRVIAAEDTNDTVTAAEEFRFRGAASWSAGTIRYGDIERGRVAGDTQLLYLLASASLIEMTSELYAQNLVALFAEDREAVAWLQQRWAPEERQHGLALKRYVQAAWPDFDWDVAYRGFHAEFVHAVKRRSPWRRAARWNWRSAASSRRSPLPFMAC